MRVLIGIAVLAAAAALAGADDPAPAPSPAVSPRPRAHAKPARSTIPSPAPKQSPSPAAGETTPSSPDARKAGHVYSNEDLPKDSAPPTVPSPGLAGAGRGAVTLLGPGIATPEPQASAEPVPLEETEGYWRPRAEQAYQAIDAAERHVTELQAHIDNLRNDRGATDAMDPNREQNRQARIAQAQADLERANADVARAREALSSLEDDARRKFIPPGWLRPRTLGGFS